MCTQAVVPNHDLVRVISHSASALGAAAFIAACGPVNDDGAYESVSLLQGAPTASLINAGNAQTIAGFDPIADGATITLASLPTKNLSIRANPSQTVGSVGFVLDSTYSRVEGMAPYSLCGDTTSSYTPCSQLDAPGAHTLSVTAYSGANATGSNLGSTTVHFTVQSSAQSTPPPPTGATSTGTLVNATNALPIAGFDPIAEGATITLSTLTTQQLSIRANPSQTVGSVNFSLDGSYSHVESTAPYSLCGDVTSSYTACSQLTTAGAHTLTFSMFSGTGATGTALGSSTLHFTVQASGQVTPPPVSNAAFPLHVSTNNRYLVDQSNVPFPIFGDAGWEVPHNLSATDQGTYLTNRVGHGFNSVMVEAIEHKFTVNKPPRDLSSNLPFGKRLDAATYTGSPNGTTSTNGVGISAPGPTYAADPYTNINAQAPDFTYPVSAYWTGLDGFVSRCAAQHVAVFLFPAYAGYGGGDEGWMAEMVANDAVIGVGGFGAQSWSNAQKSKLWNYGAWLAQHYASFPNIVWILGGDFSAYSTVQATAIANLLAGMKSVAGQQSKLWTAHWARPSLATDITQFASSMNLESVYENSSAATESRNGYAHSPALPAFELEDYYEGSTEAGSPVRRFHWWTLFGAPAGQFFANDTLWPIGTNWKTALDTSGASDMSRLISFARSIAWEELVPSGLNGQKTIIASNGSTSDQADYVACAASSTVAACYVPPAWAKGTLGVNATSLPKAFRARWLNPVSGAYTLISASVPNTGTATFTPPGNNGSGSRDWVLVMDVTG